jgi:protein O-mannosyl-transferase
LEQNASLNCRPYTGASATRDEKVPGSREVRPRGRWRKGYLLVLVPAFVAYARTLDFSFVYDDRAWIVRNPALHSWRFLSEYFATNVWAGVYGTSLGNYYRPVFMLWMRLQVALFGTNPHGYHLGVVLLHLFVTLLVYHLALRIARDRAVAVCAALVFGLHPVHIESVAWIAGATDPLVSALLIGSFLCWLKCHDAPARSRCWWAASLGLYGLALLAKETALIFPLIVAAHVWIHQRGDVGRGESLILSSRKTEVIRQTIPFVILMALYLAARVEALKGFSHLSSSISPLTVIFTWPSLAWLWARHLAWPTGLSTYYNLSYVRQPTWADFGLPALGILGAGLLLAWGAVRSKTVAFTVPWLLFPLITLVDLRILPRDDFAHDRFLYLPSVGFAVIVGYLIQRLPASRRTVAGYPFSRILVTTLLCSALTIGTIWQSSYFQDDQHFYTHGYRVAPDNILAKANYAALLGEQGKLAASAELLSEVVSKEPDDWSATYNLGLTCYKLNRLEGAVRFLSRATALAPASPGPYLYLGLARLKLGMKNEAESALRRAIALQPDGYGYHFALGMVLKSRGELTRALDEFQAELQHHPENEAAQKEIEQVRALQKQGTIKGTVEGNVHQANESGGASPSRSGRLAKRHE